MISLGQTLNSDLCCQQLKAIAQKRPALVNKRGIVRIVLYVDNVKPHKSILTPRKLLGLDWQVLMHPPYNPDLTPCDYYLLTSVANDLAGEKKKRFFKASATSTTISTILVRQKSEKLYIVWLYLSLIQNIAASFTYLLA